MNNDFKPAKTLMAIGLLVYSLTLISWQDADSTERKHQHHQQFNGDTTKPRKHADHDDEFRVDYLDKAMQNLDLQLQKMDLELQKMDFSNIEKQVNEALAKVDFAKIKLDAENAMKNVDWTKIKMDVDKAMKEAEVSMKEINSEKFKKEMEEMTQKLKKENFKVQLDAEKIHKEVEQGMAKAKEGIEKAKAEIKNMQDFTDALEKDGLINKKSGYKIKVQDGELYINGNKQPKETYEKYKQYYRKDRFSLNNDGDSISSL